MNGKKLLIGLSYIDRKYIEESEQDMPVRNAITTTINQNKAQLKCLSTKKIWLIAAVIALTLLLVGCAIIYARWSSGLEDWFRPSNTIRQQAEQSGLSVIYPQDQIQEDGLSATDQGITVSVKQTIVDQWRASIVLKIEGFELPDGVRPCFYGERPTLDGNAEFCGSAGYHFYDGIVTNESGESVYKNGEPVKEEHYPMEEFSDYSSVVGRYYLPDGSMELTLSYNFIDSSGANLGKILNLSFTGFDKETDLGKATTETERLVSGSWKLSIPLNGTERAIEIAPNAPLNEDGMTLLKATIGQMSGQIELQLTAYYAGYESNEGLNPSLAGIRMKDGSFVQVAEGGSYYKDRDNLVYVQEYRNFNEIIDLSQVEALAFQSGWEKDAAGKPTIPIYEYIPVS